MESLYCDKSVNMSGRYIIMKIHIPKKRASKVHEAKINRSKK